MSILRNIGSAVATALKSVAKFVGRAGIGAARLASRVVSATARVGYRAAYVATGVAANAAHSLIGLFGRGAQELPEAPEGQVFSPTDQWLEEMEESHLEHEMGEVEKLIEDDPRAIVYSYLAAPNDNARRAIDLSMLPDDVRSWAYRMIEPERVLIRRAGCEKMLQHLDGTKLIKGVRRMTPREAVIDFTQRKLESAFEMTPDFGPGTEMRLAM